jgi:hypothetical protein
MDLRFFLLVGIIIFTLPVFADLLNPVEFNQFYIHGLGIEYRNMGNEELGDMIMSVYSSGLNILSGNSIWSVNDPENPEEVFEYIFSWVPSYAVIYPTEEIYYFKVGEISGNLRPSLSLFSYTYKGEGLIQEVEIQKEEKEGVLTVSYKGKSVSFKLPEETREIEVLPGEEVVGYVFDESGMDFFLLFNKEKNSFYYVLGERVTDKIKGVGEELFLGGRSDFVFYKDGSRMVLVGVNKKNVEENNYLDGPGDQVPLRADISGFLYKAYPLEEGEIDQHGVFLNRTVWSRVLINPYMQYENLNDVKDRIRGCGAGELSCIAREYWKELILE